MEFGDVIILNSFFNLHLTGNFGVSFSMMASDKTYWQYILIFIAILICIYFVKIIMGTKKFSHKIPIILIISGAIGNVIDRLHMGFVIDFIQIHYNDLFFPTFNIADTYISIGVFFFILNQIKTHKKLTISYIYMSYPI